MITKIYNIKGDIEGIAIECAEILKNGGIVAFPTETVYGLGADAFNRTAVNKIYKAKGRAKDNPLIFHISSLKMLEKLAVVPSYAKKLIGAFWPGPLTLVFKSKIDSQYTFGLDTVAVRMPDNLIALKLIEKLGEPVVAPSANISGKPSATAFKHVMEDFTGKIDAGIDGGETVFGIESTVLDATQYPFALLRAGAISVEDIEKSGGKVVVANKTELLKRSPGTRYRHYAPDAKVILIDKIGDLKKFAAIFSGKITAFMGIDKPDFEFGSHVLFKNKTEYARMLFSTLRYMDAKKVDVVFAQLPDDKGIGLAIRDRLKRAAE